MRLNGVDVTDSCRIVSINGNGTYNPILISESVSMDAGDYIEIVFAATATSVSLEAVPATAFAPSAPAATLVVEQIQP